MLLIHDVCTQGAILGINKVLNTAHIVVWLEKAREYIKQCVLASCLKLSCYMYIFTFVFAYMQKAGFSMTQLTVCVRTVNTLMILDWMGRLVLASAQFQNTKGTENTSS